MLRISHTVTLTPEQREERRAQLRRLEDAYYNGTPIASDAEYDRLKEELGETRPVGAATDKDAVKLPTPMLSLAKHTVAAELWAWWQKRNFMPIVIEAKLDGMSGSLLYNKGQLSSAFGRGDGTIGSDITVPVTKLPSALQSLPVPFTGEVRGELAISRAALAACNRERVTAGEKEFANCRNAAAGAFATNNPEAARQRGVEFVAFSCVPHENFRAGLTDYDFVRHFPRNTSNVFRQLVLLSRVELDALVEILGKFQSDMDAAEFDQDGVVVKALFAEDRVRWGSNDNHPNWAVAFKFPPKPARTTVLAIDLQVGRSGVITPVAKLAPVSVGGVVVTSATLFNENEVVRLGVNIGSEVMVIRAGEVIPHVDRVVSPHPSGPWRMPALFFDSKGRAHMITRTEGEAAHRLANPSACEDVLVAQLLYALGPDSLDWDGAGEALIRTLLPDFREVADYFELDPSAKLGDGDRARFFRSREEVKKQPLWRFINALAPAGVGRTRSRDLAHAGGSWRSVTQLPIPLLTAILGPALIDGWIANLPQLRLQLDRLERLGCLKAEESKGPQPLAGMVICVTGGVSMDRPAYLARLENLGAMTKDSVTKKVTHLVVGIEPGATKLRDAEKKGTKIMTEQELETLINANSNSGNP